MTDNNVIDFPQIGFNLTPPNTIPPARTPVVDSPATPAAATGRTSPLDTLSALPEPGLNLPVIQPLQPGFVPDTFRAEPASYATPRIGALSLAAILAVAVASLRGIHTAVTAWRANREQRQTVADLASSGNGKGKKEKKGKVPPAHEYGRKTVGRTGGGGGRAGGGPGRSGKSGSGSTGATGRKSPAGSGTKSGASAGAKKSRANSGSASGKAPKRPGAVRQPSQRGGAAVKKNRTSDRTGTSTGDKKTNRGGPKGLRRAGGPTGLLRSKKTRAGDSGGPTNPKKPSPSKASKTSRTGKKSGGPTTGAGAPAKDTKKAAARRWKRRQKRMTKPPIWASANNPKNNKGPAGATTGPSSTTPKAPPKAAPKSNAKKGKTTGSRGADNWRKVRERARKRWGQQRGTERPGPGPSGTPGDTFGYRARGRKSPFEAAADATIRPDITVEWPGHEPRGQRPALSDAPNALNPAPTPHTDRPGTRRPRPMPPASPLSKEPSPMATHLPTVVTGGTAMDPQHATEITLDDALNTLGDLNKDAFNAHDESTRLAEKARRLRDTLVLFAQDLAVRHNLIGPLFAGAMARLAESMDLLARMADEMQVSSLEAAEMAESADNDLNDAYRPISQATADAGLATPSAPIHNRA